MTRDLKPITVAIVSAVVVTCLNVAAAWYTWWQVRQINLAAGHFVETIGERADAADRRVDNVAAAVAANRKAVNGLLRQQPREQRTTFARGER